MPIYEYECKNCHHRFETLMLSKDDPEPKCPKCSGEKVERLLSCGFIRPKGIPTGSGGFSQPSCKPSG